MTRSYRDDFEHRSLSTVIKLALFCAGFLFIITLPSSATALPEQVKVGLYENPPLVFTDEIGEPAGLFVDIIDAIARAEGFAVIYVPGTWEQGLQRLEAGEIDLVQDIAYSTDRAERYDFVTEPVILNWVQLYVHDDAGLGSLTDLDGESVSVLRNSIQVGEFRDMLQAFDVACDIVEVDDNATALTLLETGSVRAAIVNRLYGHFEVGHKPIHGTPVMFAPHDACIAAAKGRHGELLATVSDRLVQMKANPASVYYHSIDRWLGRSQILVVPLWLRWTLGVSIAAVALLSLTAIFLRHRVRRRSAELANRTTALHHEAEGHGRTREDLRMAEEHLLHAQKMEAIGTLAGGLAHDFNNYLTAAIINVELARSTDGTSDASGKYLDGVRTAIDRATHLTRQLLAFSCKQFINPRIIDLHEAIEKFRPMIRQIIPSDVDLVIRFKTQPGLVLVDPPQIEQVVLNLVINAKEAMPDGGHLLIETDIRRVDQDELSDHPGHRAGEYVVLLVSDDGEGMKDEVLRRIFEPFYSTRDTKGSTGLGLAMVYGIVEQHDGFVTVQTIPGKGSTFTIHLPLQKGDVQPAAHEETSEPLADLSGNETILLVEDAGIVRRAAAKALRGYGYTVLEAEDGRSALTISRARTEPIHLLCTDVVMPEMNGLELAQHLRRERPETRVLFVSGYSAEIIAKRGVIEAGVCLVEKPYSIKKLARVIHGLVNKAESCQ